MRMYRKKGKKRKKKERLFIVNRCDSVGSPLMDQVEPSAVSVCV